VRFRSSHRELEGGLFAIEGLDEKSISSTFAEEELSVSLAMSF